jgi:predicted dehydrogenase
MLDMADSRQIRFGIAGAGIRGELFGQAIRQIPGAKLSAICDLNEARGAAVAGRLGVEAYPGHDAMLDANELDALIVTTPDFAHRDVAVDGAARGLHLMIEKPLATTVAEAREIQAAVKKAGIQCMVGFENRWHQAFVHMHGLAAAGELGNVLTQNAVLSNSYYVPTTMLSWGARSSPGWFLMSHTVDLALWLCGRKVAKAYAQGSRGILAARGVDTWDVVQAILTMDDGTTASFTSSWVLPDASPAIVKFTYQLTAERAAIDYDLQGHALEHSGATEYRSVPLVGTEVDGVAQSPPVWMIQYFARQLMSGQPVTPTVEDGVRVTEIIVAVHESLKDGVVHSLNNV